MAGHCPMDRYLTEGDEWFDRLYLANVVGWPAMSLPAPVAPGAPPIGAQLMAGPGHERLLLHAADQLLGPGMIIPAVDAVTEAMADIRRIEADHGVTEGEARGGQATDPS